MDCAETLGRIEAARLGPGKLRSLETDQSEAGVALREHMSTCQGCARELSAWRHADLVLRAATPDSLSASPDVRAGLLAAIATRPRSEAATARLPAVAPAEVAVRLRAGVPDIVRIGIAAALGALIFVAGAALGGPLGIVPPSAPGSGREAGAAFVSAAVDRVLALPTHQVVELRDASGARSGTILFDDGTRELVVVSRTLRAASTDQEYGCYVERDGMWTRIGRMVEYEGISWWVGELSEPPDAGRPGDRFVVALEVGSPTLSGAF